MKKAIVMGATSGIGQEVVRVLLDRGWQVGIAGRREGVLRNMCDSHPGIVAHQRIDVTDADAVVGLQSLIQAMGGDVDLYFHSSGIGFQNPLLDSAKELATVETNVTGFVRMINFVFELFAQRPQHQAHIAVISSIAGTRGLGAAPAYSASKRFVNHYMECLEQLCSIRGIGNVHLHDIRPGFVHTALLDDDSEYPMQLDPRDVAADIVDGIEDDSSIITIDWRYRCLVALWRLIPRWIWVRMKVVSA